MKSISDEEIKLASDCYTPDSLAGGLLRRLLAERQSCTGCSVVIDDVRNTPEYSFGYQQALIDKASQSQPVRGGGVSEEEVDSVLNRFQESAHETQNEAMREALTDFIAGRGGE